MLAIARIARTLATLHAEEWMINTLPAVGKMLLRGTAHREMAFSALGICLIQG
jgi:hypothetical protein